MNNLIRFCKLLVCLASLSSFSGQLLGQAVHFLGSPVDFGNLVVCTGAQSDPSPCSKTLTLVYQVDAGGTLQKPLVLTKGMTFQEFSFSRSSCEGTVTTGSRCNVVITFTPKAATAYTGSVEIVSGAGQVLATTMIYGAGQASNSFTISVSPQSLTLSPGSTRTVQVTVDTSEGFAGAGQIAMHTLPAGVSSIPGVLALTPGTQTVKLAAGYAVAPGTQNVVFTGNSGTLLHSATLKLTVMLSGASVTTQHNDNARDGVNPYETALTPQTVNAAAFGKLWEFAADGKVDAQPLYVNGLTVAGQTHNVVITATEHGTAYSFDADTGAVLWQHSTLAAKETPSDDRGCSQISPEIGITSTPVIDTSFGANGAVFLVAMSKDANGAYHHRLHALDLTTGAELPGGPTEIKAQFPGTGYGSTNGTQVFDPGQYEERAGLLLANGQLYLAWASHCDDDPYTGWLMAYSESTLQQASVLNLTPNGPSQPHFANGEGAIWMSGTGPAADTQGFLYLLDGNGTFDSSFDSQGFPAKGDFGNSFLKLSAKGNELTVADYFVHYNVQKENPADEDLGSGGAVLLPALRDENGILRNLAVGAGKDSTIFVVDRNKLGKFDPGSDNTIYQEVPNVLSGTVFSAPAFFNNTLYYVASGDHLKSIPVVQALLAKAASAQSAATFTFPGATPSISSNGTQNGIVWVTDNKFPAGILHAYDATNVASELYNSDQAVNARDHFTYSKFVPPTIANGKVYVATPTGVAAFGLLH